MRRSCRGTWSGRGSTMRHAGVGFPKLDARPRLPDGEIANRAGRYSVDSADGVVAFATTQPNSNLRYDGFGQFRRPVTATGGRIRRSTVAPLRDGVDEIVSASPVEQMGVSDTASNIAMVECTSLRRIVPSVQLVCEPMSSDLSSVQPEDTVAAVIGLPQPQPAGSEFWTMLRYRAVLVDSFPETICQRRQVAGINTLRHQVTPGVSPRRSPPCGGTLLSRIIP
jgi:hypothetical protein